MTVSGSRQFHARAVLVKWPVIMWALKFISICLQERSSPGKMLQSLNHRSRASCLPDVVDLLRLQVLFGFFMSVHFTLGFFFVCFKCVCC